MKDFDSMLAQADPARQHSDALPLVSSLAASITTEDRAVRTSRWSRWKTSPLAIPAVVGGMFALTAAAVIPLSLSINGQEVEVDATIPIVYTTDSGVKISCEVGIYVGDPRTRTSADEAVADFLANEDWTGIGQEIYEEAIANPFVPTSEDGWLVDTQELRDKTSFIHATHLIDARIPSHLLEDGMSSGGTTTCTGQLR